MDDTSFFFFHNEHFRIKGYPCHGSWDASLCSTTHKAHRHTGRETDMIQDSRPVICFFKPRLLLCRWCGTSSASTHARRPRKLENKSAREREREGEGGDPKRERSSTSPLSPSLALHLSVKPSRCLLLCHCVHIICAWRCIGGRCTAHNDGEGVKKRSRGEGGRNKNQKNKEHPFLPFSFPSVVWVWVCVGVDRHYSCRCEVRHVRPTIRDVL